MENGLIKIEVTDRDDAHNLVEAPVDMNLNLMEVLKGSGYDIQATCGGMALCSTCHVYVLSEHELNEATEDEEDMLDQAFDVMENSRLGCQIKITEKLDGLKVKLAPESL
ncbi:MAG: ferredoxin [Saprospirales bacterium]|nr:MAG: ferredoxin [Saprospirales bacterium]